MSTSEINNTEPKLYIKSKIKGDNVVINEIRGEIEQKYTLEELKLKDEYEKAYSAGWNECNEKSEQIQSELNSTINELNSKIETMQQSVEKATVEIPQALSEYLKQLEDQLKKEIYDVSFVIAERILSREVKRDPNILTIINDSMTNITQFDEIKVLLNHEDYNMLLQEHANELATDISVGSDQSLQQGDVKVECEKEFIDASVTMRLRSLKDLLYDKLSSTTNDNTAGTES